MLRYTAFAVLTCFAGSVASAQQPLFPTWGNGAGYPAANCPHGFCGTQPGTCINGNCAASQMICGPNGCYMPGTAPGGVNPYRPGLPQPTYYPQPVRTLPYTPQPSPVYRALPVYSAPSSSYPGFPNLPTGVRRERSLPGNGVNPWFGIPMPANGGWNSYPPLTGAWDLYDANSGPGVLH